MSKEFPFIVRDENDELTFEKCCKCDNDAMMGIEDKGYCGMHYAEAKGWLVVVEDKDAEAETGEVANVEA